jgi:hypothetical protein
LYTAVGKVFAGLVQSSIVSLLHSRCADHTWFPGPQALACHASAEQVERHLDAGATISWKSENGNSPQSGVVAFEKEFLEMIQAPSTGVYLRAASSWLRRREITPDREGFWEWNLRMANGNENLALKRVALLFQDSSDLAHVDYLKALSEMGDQSIEPARISELQEANRLLDHTPGVALYPPSVKVGVRSQYHFYVIAYLARKIAAGTDVQVLKKGAMMAPFFFSSAYENTKRSFNAKDSKEVSSDDMSGGAALLWRTLSRAANDAQPLTEEENADDFLEDSYLGYAGAHWGAGLEGQMLDFEAFKKGFTRSPSKVLRAAFAN